ncbi:tetratricopeptide repeat protein [Clostridium sediminicola]|uniref:tetratricopeptide repeat protein n=1 Tax=Clostridium sediminicola TaxID=3114879 RepID=UPI0031F1F00C
MDFEENFEIAEKYYIKGEYEKAIRYFEICFEIKESYDCLNYIGCCYLGLSDYKTAIRIFNSIISSCPYSERPVFNLGRVYLKLGDLDKALSSFEKAIYINPFSEDGYYYLGLYYQRVSNFEKAKMYYKKSLDLDQYQPETYLNLGICCYELGLYEESLNALTCAYKYDSDYVEAIAYKAEVYISMKDYEKALKEFLVFNDFEPDDIDNILDIAYCYYKIGDFQNSYVWNNKALAINPKNEFSNKLSKQLTLKL